MRGRPALARAGPGASSPRSSSPGCSSGRTSCGWRSWCSCCWPPQERRASPRSPARPRPPGMPEYDAATSAAPFIVMNPRSGGGKVGRFGLKEKAEALGAEVALLEGPGTVDVVALAQRALARGADLLGVAGGDGTQALVAGVAAEHDVPFLVISAGTRNHFALDLGLDREDPSTCLAALTDDAVELRVDLGDDRRAHVRQQRLLRRVRRRGAEPGLPGRQDPHDPGRSCPTCSGTDRFADWWRRPTAGHRPGSAGRPGQRQPLRTERPGRPRATGAARHGAARRGRRHASTAPGRPSACCGTPATTG